MITFATGCSGIGAPEVAWGDRLGWKCLWCSEIEPFPSAVLAYRWPDVPNVGDFLTIADQVDADELEAPDVFIAGTPCQAFSIAGLRQSIKDPRGGLTLEYIRIADAFDRQRRRRGLPETILLWENVPGVFSAKDNPFGCFLAGLLGLDAPVIPEGGGRRWRYYGDLVGKRRVAWRLLDAQYFGVAQRRRRVFLIATARPGFRPARGLFECGSVPRTAPPSRKAWARTAADAEGRTGTTSYGTGNGQVNTACGMQEEVSQTLNCMHDRQAVMCVDKHMCSSIGFVPALEREGAHELTVYPINSMIIGAGVKEKDTHPLGIGGESDPSFTLCAKHHHAVVAYETGPGASNQEFFAQRGSMLVPVCYTKTAHPHNLDEGQGFVQTDLAKTLNCHSVPSSELRAEELVVCFQQNYVAIENHAQGAAPVNCQGGSNIGVHLEVTETVTAAANSSGNNMFAVWTAGFVRRLTTVECARLQGFPDHHTEIPWKGKPPELCPKGPQYKAYGNAMCVNVIEWLGRVIEGELKR